jgi:hypothetical protein
MSNEQHAVLREVLRRVPVTLAEQLVIGALLEMIAANVALAEGRAVNLHVPSEFITVWVLHSPACPRTPRHQLTARRAHGHVIIARSSARRREPGHR